MTEHRSDPDLTGLAAAVEARVAPLPFAALRERHRRRQRRRAATAGLCVVLLAGAGVLVAQDLRSGERQTNLVSQDQAEDFGFRPTDVEFVSATTGWAIGTACTGLRCRIGVRWTRDGGATWSGDAEVATVDREARRLRDPRHGGAQSLRFLDERTGYAFNPSQYVTHDGGRTWAPDAPRGSVTGTVTGITRGGDWWSLVHHCEPGTRCEWLVLGAPSQPIVFTEEAQLRRSDESVGWLLAWNRSGRTTLYRTVDGARVWTTWPVPCDTGSGRQLSPVDRHTAWLVCSDDEGPGVAKQVFRTTDGGASWQPAGTVGDTGLPTDLVGLSAQTAYLATKEPARLLVTRDGGATWRPAPGAHSRFGFSNLQFLDDRHGWAMGDRGDLWRTTDGLTWHHLPLPAG